MFDLESVHNFLKGVNLFYERFNRRESSQNIVWQEGSTKVIKYIISNRNKKEDLNTESKSPAYVESSKNSLPILFFIPSLINKSYILDLHENASIVQYFANNGFAVYLVDFSDPLEEELNMNLVDYIHRLNKAINDVCKNKPVITIGYCLGGVFSLMLTKPKNFLGQVLIATPIDFTHFQKLFNLNQPLILQNFKSALELLDRVPHILIQTFFSFIDLSKIWQKFCQFPNIQNQSEIDRFLIIEQWVNDGISITKNFCMECLNLITENSLETLLSKEAYNYPTLIINGTEDKIVPIESSLPLYSLIDDKEIIVEKTGHIGLIISQTAQEKIWTSILKWANNLGYRTS